MPPTPPFCSPIPQKSPTDTPKLQVTVRKLHRYCQKRPFLQVTVRSRDRYYQFHRLSSPLQIKHKKLCLICKTKATRYCSGTYNRAIRASPNLFKILKQEKRESAKDCHGILNGQILIQLSGKDTLLGDILLALGQAILTIANITRL